MAKAYVLVTTENNVEQDVKRLIEKIQGVKSVELVLDVYDIVVTLECEDMHSLKETVNGSIGLTKGVRSTATMVVAE